MWATENVGVQISLADFCGWYYMPQYVCFYYLAINECSAFVGAALIAVLGVDRLIALTMPLKFVYTFGVFTQIFCSDTKAGQNIHIRIGSDTFLHLSTKF